MTAAAGRRRPSAVGAVLVALAVAAVAAAAVAVALSGGPEASEAAKRGSLAWVGRPRVIEAPGDPRDRILTGTVRNGSLEPLEVEARDLRIVDEGGRPLRGNGIFLSTFVRGIYSASRIDQASDFERRRTGRLARISPGRTRPLTFAWRSGPESRPAERIDYGTGWLPVPRGPSDRPGRRAP